MNNWKLISKDYRKLIIFIYIGNILGFIYLLTDGPRGKLIKVLPEEL